MFRGYYREYGRFVKELFWLFPKLQHYFKQMQISFGGFHLKSLIYDCSSIDNEA